LDKGDDNDTGYGACLDHEYVPHIALKRDERPPRSHEHTSRRWVVERSFAWLARFRRLAKDYERLPETVAGLHLVALSSLMLARMVKLLLGEST